MEVEIVTIAMPKQEYEQMQKAFDCIFDLQQKIKTLTEKIENLQGFSQQEADREISFSEACKILKLTQYKAKQALLEQGIQPNGNHKYSYSQISKLAKLYEK